MRNPRGLAPRSVNSPNDTRREVSEKVDEWISAGVRLVWVVDPKRKIVIEYNAKRQICVLKESDTLDGGEVVPGFSLPVSEIFS